MAVYVNNKKVERAKNSNQSNKGFLNIIASSTTIY